MKLYYAPHTCSLSPHIILNELDLPFELIRVNNKTKQTSDGRDFLTINPKGYVAALEVDNGQVLTEGPAILQYLADLKPEKNMAPPLGSWERIRLQEWLSFINSEVHAGSAPLFNTELPDEVKELFSKRLFKRYDLLESTLSHQGYLMGNIFSVADAYLYTVLGWSRFFNIDLQQWPLLAAYTHKIKSRPSVLAALEAEQA